MLTWTGQSDKDKVDEMATAALTLYLPGLHHPGSVTAGHSERHPLSLAVPQSGALAATTQRRTHRRRLTFGADVDALGHVGRPQLIAVWLGAHPA